MNTTGSDAPDASDAAPVPYDEFGMFRQNAEEWEIPYPGPPTVRRERVEFAPGPS